MNDLKDRLRKHATEELNPTLTIALREAAHYIAQLEARLTGHDERKPLGYVTREDLGKLESPRVAGVGMMVNKQPSNDMVAVYIE